MIVRKESVLAVNRVWQCDQCGRAVAVLQREHNRPRPPNGWQVDGQRSMCERCEPPDGHKTVAPIAISITPAGTEGR